MFWLFSNPPPASYISSRKCFVQHYKSWKCGLILLSARKSDSRFDMTKTNEVSLNRPKVFPIFCVIFLFFKSKLFPIAVRFSAEVLSLRWIPVSEWFLEIRSLFLLILLNHLPQVIQILHLFGLSGLLSHSVFWDVFLMHLTLPILHSQQSEYLLPKFSPRTKHVPEGFSKSSFILTFPVCQDVLVISQTAIAFHRIRPPLIIRSTLQ